MTRPSSAPIVSTISALLGVSLDRRAVERRIHEVLLSRVGESVTLSNAKVGQTCWTEKTEPRGGPRADKRISNLFGWRGFESFTEREKQG